MNTLQEIAETLKFNAVNCVAENDLADALLTLEVLREAVFKAVDAIAALEPLSQAEGQEPVAVNVAYIRQADMDRLFVVGYVKAAIYFKPTGDFTVPLYPAETRSGQSIAAPSRAEVILELEIHAHTARKLLEAEFWLPTRVLWSRLVGHLETAIRALSPSATNVDSDGGEVK